MVVSKWIARQLGRPTGILGWFAGQVWNRRNTALNDTLLERLALQPTDRVLEVGFGGGYLLQRMAAQVTDGRLAGVDISPAIVAAAQNRFRRAIQAGQIELRCAPVEALPYPAQTFTKVYSVNSIFYWQDLPQAISEMRRVLADGGRLALCFTCKASLERKGFAQNIRLYDADDVAQVMQAHGFREIQVALFADAYRQYACLSGRAGETPPNRDYCSPSTGQPEGYNANV